MRQLVSQFLNNGVSRRDFIRRLTGLGLTATAVAAILETLDRVERTPSDSVAASERTITGTGGELLVAQARAAGVDYLFTNPGSFEVGFFDAVVDDPQIHLIEALHEGIVISMADGYHKVSGKPAFVNVHAIAGTAQMAGQLYNACRDGSALVITAGFNDNEVWSDEVSLGPRPGFDQKDVNRQFTKISWDARQAESLPLMLRRAFKVAMTDPGGPVYLATADYALEQRGASASILPSDRFMARPEIHPDPSAVERAARALIEAKNPVVIIGDEVWKANAQADLLSLADHMALPVVKPGDTIFACTYQSFPTSHPLHQGSWGRYSKGPGENTDLIFFIGAPDVGGKIVPRSPELPLRATFIRLGMDTTDQGRNYPTDIVLVSDIKAGIRDLRAAIDSLLTKNRQASIATPRFDRFKRISAEKKGRIRKEIAANAGKSPIHPYEICQVMAEVLDKNAILVSENLTGKFDSFDFGFRDNEMMYLGNSGASLGWGIGAATGAKLAGPNRQVVCSIGDGSVMYSASGFWSQVRYQLPVLTVVWNNKNYQTVRHAYHSYGGRMAETGKYAGMYLGDPDIDFVQLAGSQGVKGERASNASELRAALARGIDATKSGQPYLVEVATARYGGGAGSTWHESLKMNRQQTQK